MASLTDAYGDFSTEALLGKEIKRVLMKEDSVVLDEELGKLGKEIDTEIQLHGSARTAQRVLDAVYTARIEPIIPLSSIRTYLTDEASIELLTETLLLAIETLENVPPPWLAQFRTLFDNQ